MENSSTNASSSVAVGFASGLSVPADETLRRGGGVFARSPPVVPAATASLV